MAPPIITVDEDNGIWCIAADVYKFTGETVSIQDLTRAQDIIDMFSGTTFGSYEQIGTRNLRHLNRATIYQAAWVVHRPDLFSHMDVDNTSQDGASHTPGHENAQLLAPMSRRWLARLTWANKPLRVRKGYIRDYGIDQLGPRDSAAADDNKIWFPL